MTKEQIVKIIHDESYCDNDLGNFVKQEDWGLIADEIIKLFDLQKYSENQLRLFAKEMQNISVMDSDLTSDEYVDMWLNSLK